MAKRGQGGRKKGNSSFTSQECLILLKKHFQDSSKDVLGGHPPDTKAMEFLMEKHKQFVADLATGSKLVPLKSAMFNGFIKFATEKNWVDAGTVTWARDRAYLCKQMMMHLRKKMLNAKDGSRMNKAMSWIVKKAEMAGGKRRPEVDSQESA